MVKERVSHPQPEIFKLENLRETDERRFLGHRSQNGHKREKRISGE
jgi:hypothetical protein